MTAALLNYDQVSIRVIKTVAEQFGVDLGEVKLGTDLMTDLGGDSLDAIEVAATVEDEFDIEIPDADLDSIRTVQHLVDAVVKRLGAPQ